MENQFDVLNYLLENPHFLIKHANKLGISFDSKKIRSIAEVQILANKNKVDKISHQYQEILHNIYKNEIILHNLDKLYFNLMECKKLSQVITVIANSLNQDFSLSIFIIKFVIDNLVNNTIQDIEKNNILNVNENYFNDLKNIMKPFGDTKCIIESLYSWLPKQSKVESFLHMPLHYKKNFLGFILIAHKDYKYFDKDLATNFMDSMAQAISITIHRILY